MKTSMLRVQLSVLSVVAVCVSGKESFTVKDASTGEAESSMRMVHVDWNKLHK